VFSLGLIARADTIARAEDAAADGVVINTGAKPVEVDLVVLTSPSLALEIVDAHGTPLRMLPPPTPGRPDTIVLAPGSQRTIPFRAFLPPSTPPGAYRVRLRYETARSPWIDLRIDAI